MVCCCATGEVVEGERPVDCVGDSASSTGLHIQSRPRRFFLSGMPSHLSNGCGLGLAVFVSADVPSTTTSSALASVSESTGVGIISIRVSRKITRLMGWNIRFAGRLDMFARCRLGKGLLRRMLLAPNASV